MPVNNSQNINWERKFQMVKDFIEEFDRFPKHRESYRGENIGHWCWMQKRTADQGKLLPERYEKLKEIGLLDNRKDVAWEKRFQLACEFLQEYGRLPKQGESLNGVNIGSWLAGQRLQASREFYPEDRRKKLEDNGLIPPNRMSCGQYSWERKIQLLEQFVKEYGRLPKETEMYQDVNIGTWTMSQKRSAKVGSLSPE